MRWIVLLMVVCAPACLVWAEQGKGSIIIKKVSADKEHVVVTFENTSAGTSDQIHVFVDNKFEKVVAGKTAISVDLEPGNHTVELRDSTSNQQPGSGCKRVKVVISLSDTESSRSLSPEGGEECKP